MNRVVKNYSYFWLDLLESLGTDSSWMTDRKYTGPHSIEEYNKESRDLRLEHSAHRDRYFQPHTPLHDQEYRERDPPGRDHLACTRLYGKEHLR